MPDLAPPIADKIAAAEQQLAELQELRGDAALAATMDPRNGPALQKLEERIAAVEAELRVLRAAHVVALDHDAHAAVSRRYADGLAQLEAFSKWLLVRDDAARMFGEGAALCAEAWKRMRNVGIGITSTLPAGTHLPPGFNAYSASAIIGGTAFPASLEKLISAEFYRHADITQIGQEWRAMPGAGPLTLGQMYAPATMEPLAEAIARANDYLFSSVKFQIERTYLAETQALEKPAAAAA